MDRQFTAILVLLLISGCRSGGNMELIERELRLQEDRIYQLEDALEDEHAKRLAVEEQLSRLQPPAAGLQKQPTSGTVNKSPARIDSPPEQPAARSPQESLPPVEVEVPGLPDSSSANQRGPAGNVSTRGNQFRREFGGGPRRLAKDVIASPGAATGTPLTRSAAEAKPAPAAGSPAESNPAAESAPAAQLPGWDEPPKSDLRMVPSVSSYRTNNSPLNPPPGRTHVRLTTQTPGTSLPISRSQVAASPAVAPNGQMARSPSERQPVPGGWSPAAEESRVQADNQGLASSANSEEQAADSGRDLRTADASAIPGPPRRRPAWAPYR